MKTFKFIKEGGKDYKVITVKEEVDRAGIKDQIAIREKGIESQEEQLLFAKEELKELKKLDVETIS